MTTIYSAIIPAFAFLAALAGVGIYRKWSTTRGLFDVPNERSSHSTPTPRGGGVVIAAVSLTGYLVLTQLSTMPFSWGYFAGGGLVAAVSLLDDIYSLPFWSRLFIHILAAYLLIADVGAWTHVWLPVVSQELELGSVVGTVLTALWVVWFINAYNFMDGIDGIAGLQVVVSGAAWAILSVLSGFPSTGAYASLVAAAGAGFLVHNWQPAKIFMGDVGSAFLGFTLAALPLLARSEIGEDRPLLPVVGVLFVWLFVVDTAWTFLKRLMKGQKVWEAHREHLYQAMVIAGWTHARVTIIYGVATAVLAVSLIFALANAGIFGPLSVFLFVAVTAVVFRIGTRKALT